jgi:hypothetical protein
MIVNLNVDLIDIDCCDCGLTFFVQKKLQSNWKRDKATFYCPNGHAQSYVKSTAEILQAEIDLKNIKIAELESDLKKANNKKSKKK